jgi:sec-independent protein translocase protein TatA
MELAFLEGPELIIVLVIVLVLFGGSRLPGLARSLGEAQRELKKAQREDDKPSTKSTDEPGASS